MATNMPHTTSAQKQTLSVLPTLSIFWKHARRYRVIFFLLIAMVVAVNVIQGLMSLYLRDVFNAIEATAMDAAFYAFFTFFILGAVRWLLYRIAVRCNNVFQPRVMEDLQITAFTYLIGHSYRFFSNSFAGSLVRKVSRLARSFEDIADQLTWNLLPQLALIITTLIIYSREHVAIAVGFALWIVLFVAVNVGIAQWKLKYDTKRAEIDTELTGTLADAISNTTTIREYTGHAFEEGLLRGVANRWRRMQTLTWNLGDINDAVQGLLMFGIEFGFLYTILRGIEAGTMTLGDFVLFQTSLAFIFDRMWDFGRVVRRLYEGFADAKEMVDILETPYEVTDKPVTQTFPVREGRIIFDHVDFAYHETRFIFKDFSLEIEPNQKVAFVGSSGAGKSTIVKILLRLFDVTAGKVLIDGRSIADVTQEELRLAIAHVPQDPALFHRSILENIRYGRRDATDEEVKEAAHLAHCDAFIDHLPNGYETLVGERGVKLSGGERQRVAIARAILKNAPILILDEATSSLDSESEALIQDALKHLMKNKTVIVIAHRLSTIMQMDRIVVIDEGKIVEDGSHDQLLKQKEGIYQKLWNIQAGGFLP